uniref:Cytochrome b n=1 Tax=Dactylella sp. TaxID=1814903 RepID=A0A482DTY8_9PEZI|nr:apocytochrome b [Dactylella sp.]
MRLLKSHPFLKLVNSYLIDGSQPSNLNFAWNFGSLLLVCLVIQIVTGVTLAMHFNPSIAEAFNSVEHIMRDVNNGWLIRYFHSNTASAFFFLVYLHIGRGIYYGSYQKPRTITWVIGTIILIAMMATGFLGYATVITNLLSAIPWIGGDFVEFIWGGFSVNNATLNRFFALHFVLPFILVALVLMHLIGLHDTGGSSNPMGVSGNFARLPMGPYFRFKDLITLFIFIWVLSLFVYFMPNGLGDSENYIPANPMQTPAAIVPEWYLLPFYAILRSIPNKLLGVIAMFAAILAILSLPYFDLSRTRGFQFKPASKVFFFVLVANFILLMALGAKHVESPFVEIGMVSTFVYFAYYSISIPSISLIENTLLAIVQNVNKHLVALFNSPLPFQGYSQQNKFGANIIVYLFIKAIELDNFKNKFMAKYVFFSFLYILISSIFIYYFGDNFVFALNTSDEVGIVDNTIPGVICPVCRDNGVETIVIRGRDCPICKTPMD